MNEIIQTLLGDISPWGIGIAWMICVAIIWQPAAHEADMSPDETFEEKFRITYEFWGKILLAPVFVVVYAFRPDRE